MPLSSAYRPHVKQAPYRRWLVTALWGAAIAAGLKLFLFDTHRVAGVGMLPGLVEGQRHVVNRFVHGLPIPLFTGARLPAFSSPDRGDVLFFHFPWQSVPGGPRQFLDAATLSLLGLNGRQRLLAGRVAGRPGDLVRVEGDGTLLVNGKPVERAFVRRYTMRIDFAAGGKRVLSLVENGKRIRSVAVSADDEGPWPPGHAVTETYVVYRERGALVQYLETEGADLERAAALLRPFPRRGGGPAFFKDLAERWIARNLLVDGDAPRVQVVPQSRMGETDTAAAALGWNANGEAWFRLAGEKEARPLIVLRDGKLHVVVPADSWFVLGDNRDAAFDSRSWGFVKRRHLVGSPLLRYWPLGTARLLE